MSKFLSKLVLFLALITFVQTFAVVAQQVKINPFPVFSSSLIDDLKTFKKSNPKISAEDFLVTANQMLDRQGFNYTFSFDAAFCQKLEQMKNAEKDQTAPLTPRGILNAVEGEPASLILPAVQFDRSDCGSCRLQMPVLEITDQTFITIVQKNNIKFYLPGNFIVNEAALLDPKNPATILTRWKIPFRTAPISVSDDGTILYIGFNDADLESLTLMIFEAGVFQFGLKKDLDPAKKAVVLKDSAKPSGSANLSVITFTKGDSKQTVRYNAACGN